jgi:hypothetical protein
LQYEARPALKPDVGRVEGYTGRKLVTSAIKTLPNAMIKIRELEDEVEKIRTFYTRKVEEVQRKADVQMRALKRGTGAGAGTGTGVDGEVNDEGQAIKSENENESDENNKEAEGPQSPYEDVITLRSELNAAREALAVLQANTANSVIAKQSETSQETYRAAELELLKLQYLRETESRLQKDRIKWQELAEERAVREERMETERRCYTCTLHLHQDTIHCYNTLDHVVHYHIKLSYYTLLTTYLIFFSL